FFSDVDRELMEIVRATSPNDLERLDLPFRDGRLQEMFFRYRARNYPDTLNEVDKERWLNFRKEKISARETIARFEKDMEKAWQKVNEEFNEESREKGQAVLNELQDYADELIQSLME
ncbi:MAG: exodeoxyribonuclease I, partial [Gammaproteobacteria bacterium]|nr:exodeoxyribonuclease I [Gammaproteobacteria bacterium]